MISNELKAKIKAAAKITDFISGYKKVGSNYKVKCPLHNENTASFTVPQENNYFTCFGCDKSGDVITLVMELNKLNYQQAVKKIADKYNIEIEPIGKQYEKPIERLEKVEKSIIEWFEQRGISNNTLLRFGITESIEWMPKAEKETKAICFNYFQNEELVNIKFRGRGKDFKLNKGSKLIFYNIDSIKDEKTAYIVEGEIDCLSMHEAGIYNVVSVPNGANVRGNTNLEYLDNCISYFEPLEKIIIAVDQDEAGERLKQELVRRLGKDKCTFLKYPNDCKDINDVLLKYGRDKVKEIAASDIQFPIDGIVTSESIEVDLLNFYDNGYPKGTEVKIDGFNEHLRLSDGQITIVTGSPGSGKSEFIDLIMATTSVTDNWKWGVCSFENIPASLHATKIAEKLTGKSFDYRKDHLQRMTRDELLHANYHINSNFNFVNTGTCDTTVDGILAKAAELVRKKGIKGFLIDPWNYIQHNIPTGQSETLYISDALTKIKMAAFNLGIHIFIVAHPAKLMKDKTTGNYEVPTLYSISGSAHFYNKADNGFTVYRNNELKTVEVHIQKVRNSWNGKLGVVEFTYDTYTRQYSFVQTGM
jgi:twinkle protein